MPGRRRSEYNPDPFQRLLEQLLEQTGEPYRQASAAAGVMAEKHIRSRISRNEVAASTT